MKTQYENQVPSQSDTMIWHVCYLLQALGYFTLFTWLIAFVIALLKRREVQGDVLLYSHVIWQMRTFTYALIWLVLSGVLFWLGILTLFIGVGFVLVAMGVGLAVINLVWAIYRIAYGWFRLYEYQIMPIRFSLSGSYFYG